MRKYVRLMADYCSSGVWDENCVNINIDILPISYWLKMMIDDWQAEYDRNGIDGIDDDFDVETFSYNGYALAKKLKRNLPDWTVMYFDESKANAQTPRSEYIKEIEL